MAGNVCCSACWSAPSRGEAHPAQARSLPGWRPCCTQWPINVVEWAPSAECGEGLMFAVAFSSGLMRPRIFDRFLPRLSVGRKDVDDADAPPGRPRARPPAFPSSET